MERVHENIQIEDNGTGYDLASLLKSVVDDTVDGT